MTKGPLLAIIPLALGLLSCSGEEPVPVLPESFDVKPTLDPEAPRGVYIPEDLEDALVELQKMLPDAVLAWVRACDEEDLVARLHMGLGMGLRTNWELWDWGDGTPSPLRSWFERKGVRHADDMTAILFMSLRRRLRGEELGLDVQVEAIRKPHPFEGVSLPRIPVCGSPSRSNHWPS